MDELFSLVEKTKDSVLSVIGIHHQKEEKKEDSIALLEEIRSRFDHRFPVYIKKVIHPNFFHGLPPHINPTTPVLYLKKRDKTEFTFYDPIKGKWVVVFSFQNTSKYGPLNHDLPLCEWPHIKRKKHSEILLDEAIKQSPIVYQKLKENNFASIDTAPLYLSIYWAFGKVPDGVLKNISSAILFHANIEQLQDVSFFMSEEISKAVFNNISEYARIFPQELISAILNNFTTEIDLETNMKWSLYLVTLKQMYAFDELIFPKRNIVSPPPPKLFSKKIQLVLREHYINYPTEESHTSTALDLSSLIGASVEPIQRPSEVFYAAGKWVDDSASRLGPLTTPAVLNITGKLQKSIESEFLRRKQEEERQKTVIEDKLKAFVSDISQKESGLKNLIQERVIALQGIIVANSLFNPGFTGFIENAIFETQLPGVNPEKTQAFRLFRDYTDVLFRIFLSKRMEYVEDYYLSKIIKQGTVIDPAVLFVDSSRPYEFTFHDLIGRRFLVWSSEEELNEANASLNRIREEKVNILSEAFADTAASSSSLSKNRLERFASLWTVDFLIKSISRKDPDIIVVDKNGIEFPGPLLESFRKVIAKRLGITDFPLFKEWFDVVVYKNYENTLLFFCGIDLKDDILPLNDLINQLDEKMKDLAGVYVREYRDAYRYLMDINNSKQFINVVSTLTGKILTGLATKNLENVTGLFPVVDSSSSIQSYNELTAFANTQNKNEFNRFGASLLNIVKETYLNEKVENKRRSLFQRLKNIFSKKQSGDPYESISAYFAMLVFQKTFDFLNYLTSSNPTPNPIYNLALRDIVEKTSNFINGASIDFIAVEKESGALDILIGFFIKKTLDDFAKFFKFIPPSIQGNSQDMNQQPFLDLNQDTPLLVLEEVPVYTAFMGFALINYIRQPFAFTNVEKFIAFNPEIMQQFYQNLYSKTDFRLTISKFMDIIATGELKAAYIRDGTANDSRFYDFEGSNQFLYSLIQRCFSIILDFTFRGFFLNAFTEDLSGGFELFEMHSVVLDYFQNSKLVSSTSKTEENPFHHRNLSTKSWIKWMRLQGGVPYVPEDILTSLYGELSRGSASRSTIARHFQDILDNYLGFIDAGNILIWPYPYFDVETMINLWVETRYSVFNIEENGIPTEPKSENSSYQLKTFSKLVEIYPSLKHNMAIFFNPILSLFYQFQFREDNKNFWTELKYAFWLLEKNNNFKMFIAGRYLPYIGMTTESLDDKLFPIVSLGKPTEIPSQDPSFLHPVIEGLVSSTLSEQDQLHSIFGTRHANAVFQKIEEFKKEDIRFNDDISEKKFKSRVLDLTYDCFTFRIIALILQESTLKLKNDFIGGPTDIKSEIQGLFKVENLFKETGDKYDDYYPYYENFMKAVKEAQKEVLVVCGFDFYNNSDMTELYRFFQGFIYFREIMNPSMINTEKDTTVSTKNSVVFKQVNEFYGYLKKKYPNQEQEERVFEMFQKSIIIFLGLYTPFQILNQKIANAYYNLFLGLPSGAIVPTLELMEQLHSIRDSCYILDQFKDEFPDPSQYYPDLVYSDDQNQEQLRGLIQKTVIHFNRLGENKKETRDNMFRLFSFACYTISNYDFVKILKYWNIDFFNISMDESTIRYAWLRDYFRRKFIEDMSSRIFDYRILLKEGDFNNFLADLTQGENFHPVRLVISKSIKEEFLDFYQKESYFGPPGNIQKGLEVFGETYLNKHSPIHYFFKKFPETSAIIKIFNPLQSRTSNTEEENIEVTLEDIFDDLKKFVPRITMKKSSADGGLGFDIGDAMLLTRIVETVLETFASRESYSADYHSRLDLIREGLYDLKEYLKADPRISFRPILDLKERKEDYDSFKFPQLSPFSNTLYFNLGSHIQTTQLIVHSISPYENSTGFMPVSPQIPLASSSSGITGTSNPKDWEGR